MGGVVFRLHHYDIIAWGLATHHAMHSEQPGSLFDWETSIRSSFNVEVGNTGIFFVEVIVIVGQHRAGTGKLMRLITSADYLHMHPSKYGLTNSVRLSLFLVFRLLARRPAQIRQATRREAKTEGC